VKPEEINVHKKSATLELRYPDGVTHTLTAEYLRVSSPSAEVRGHGPDQAVLQHGKREVQFLNIEPVGYYALQIVFSDGHDSGIYSWDYLYDLGQNQAHNWASYLSELEKAGKSRDPLFIALGH
jgi:DUF971 family protein